MVIQFACPISGERRDNTTARVVGGLVLAASLAILAIGLLASPGIAAILAGLLGGDFLLRAFFHPKYSPLAALARGIVSGLKLQRQMVDAAQKIFAARIGVAFTISATVLFGAGNIAGGAAVLGALSLCASLEAFAGFCLGCWMYTLLPKGLGNLLARSFVKQGEA